MPTLKLKATRKPFAACYENRLGDEQSFRRFIGHVIVVSLETLEAVKGLPAMEKSGAQGYARKEFRS